jgi:dihydropyrimidinase
VTDFVRLTTANPARLFGLQGRKGAIIPGADADIVLWDPSEERRIHNGNLHHAIDYTPWEGLPVKGWPTVTIRRGEVAVRDGQVLVAEGTGRFLARGPYPYIAPTGSVPDGFDASAHA